MRVELWVTGGLDDYMRLWRQRPQGGADWSPADGIGLALIGRLHAPDEFKWLTGLTPPPGRFCKKLVIDGTFEWEPQYHLPRSVVMSTP